MSSMAESGTIADIQVYVRQITQQSLVSRWYAMRARSSQSLLSSDSTLAKWLGEEVGKHGVSVCDVSPQSDEDASSLSVVFPRSCGPDKGL